MSSVHARKGDLAVLCAQLAAGATLPQAAMVAEMSERTARRRLKEPEVVETLERLADERIAAVLPGLVRLCGPALEVLESLMREDSSEQVRARAALGVLGFMLRFQDQSVEPRLEALEEALLASQRSAAEMRHLLGGLDDES